MHHAVYLPTHRHADRAIREAALDATLVSEVTGQASPLVVIEHGSEPWVSGHRAELDRCRRERGIPAVHLTRELAQTLIDEVVASAGQPRSLVGVLNPTDAAYGAGPNKMALLAAALGIDVLHRRDSDVRFDRRGEKLVAPGPLEAALIGHPLSDVADLRLDGGGGAHRIRIVASSYFGDPPLDRRDLFRAGWSFARAAEELLGSSDTQDGLDAEITQYFLVEPATRYGSDFYELDTTGRTEMGVACTWGLHEQLPEMPARRTLGCDYMQKNLSYQLGMPVVFHSRKVEHRYGGDRTDAERAQYAVQYAMREVRYVLLWKVWRTHNRSIRSAPELFGDADGNVRQSAYAASFRNALEAEGDSLLELARRYGRLHSDAARTAPEPEAARLQAIAGAVDGTVAETVQSVRQSIEEFAALVEAWPALVAAAKSLDAPRRFLLSD